MALITLEQLKDHIAAGIFELRPTEGKICFPIILRIYHKMKMGVPFDNIMVMDDLLINGHHRYLCCSLLKKPLEQNPWISPSKVTIYEWSEIQIDLSDWESAEIIERHNMNDAARSGLDIKIFKI